MREKEKTNGGGDDGRNNQWARRDRTLRGAIDKYVCNR